ncbi:MAG: hypothetical protein H0W25_21495 [Acidimicrobiia bacterium]|nr:hypothetical protein [Acidimicrobiia bacterium]
MGAQYDALRGLLLLPTGLLFVVAGVTDFPPVGDEAVSGRAGWFVAALGVALVGYAGFHRHYVTTFGRVERSRAARVRSGVAGLLIVALVCAGISLDSQVDLPVSAFGIAFAGAWLVHYQAVIGLRAYHWLTLGPLGVLSAVPVWGDVDDRVTLAMIPIGLATIALGLFDHRELVRSVRTARAAAGLSHPHG